MAAPSIEQSIDDLLRPEQGVIPSRGRRRAEVLASS